MFFNQSAPAIVYSILNITLNIDSSIPNRPTIVCETIFANALSILFGPCAFE